MAAGDRLLADARAIAFGLGDDVAWVERVVVATEALVDPGELARREDAVGELLRTLKEAGSDGNLRRQIETDIGVLVSRLPHEVRVDTEDTVLKAAIDGDHVALIAAATPYLSARVMMERD